MISPGSHHYNATYKSLNEPAYSFAHILCHWIYLSPSSYRRHIVINTYHRHYIDKIRQSITAGGGCLLQFYCNLHGHCKRCSHLVHFFGGEEEEGIFYYNNTSSIIVVIGTLPYLFIYCNLRHHNFMPTTFYCNQRHYLDGN